ncbi:hypothetical protein BCR42DRAFT_434602 [Absidia repens]|uniref:EF-hand domain-containing protein n=1 Tax=Absidia repens TaxID=90262 RepID=A0A1X2IUS2_9FUNG|nr:hypothetical protein BCR42DRAFT_434602 [Absidia repens]
MFSSVDDDKNGKSDLNVFLALVKALSNADVVQDLKEVFKVFDKDGNKYIFPDELRQVMISVGSVLSEEELNEMINEADGDKDGQINYKEYVKMVDK